MPKTNNESLPDHKIRDCVERTESQMSHRGKDRDSPVLVGSKVGGQQPVSTDGTVRICTTAAWCTAVMDFWERFMADSRLALSIHLSIYPSIHLIYLSISVIIGGVKSTSTQTRCEQFMCTSMRMRY